MLAFCNLDVELTFSNCVIKKFLCCSGFYIVKKVWEHQIRRGQKKGNAVLGPQAIQANYFDWGISLFGKHNINNLLIARWKDIW